MKTKSLAVLAAVAVPVSVTAIMAPNAGHKTEAPFAREGASIGTTLFVRRPTKTSGCALGPIPDRGCSPGAIDAGLTADVICADDFHTSDVRSVSASERRQVLIAYGLEPKSFGRTLEIDHIVSLELGGSNDIANLYPELAPGYHQKDVLENRLHKLVCAGAMTLHSAQRHIAADWIAFYTKIFGTRPVTTGSMRRKP